VKNNKNMTEKSTFLTVMIQAVVVGGIKKKRGVRRRGAVLRSWSASPRGGRGVMNRPESPAVANALATMSLVSVLLAFLLGAALALALVLALVCWYYLPALVPRQ
jgi:hypothetical protein